MGSENFWTVVWDRAQGDMHIEVSRSKSSPPRFSMRIGFLDETGKPGGWLPMNDLTVGKSRVDHLTEMVVAAERFVAAEIRIWEKDQERIETLKREEQAEQKRKNDEYRRRREANLTARAEANRSRLNPKSGKKN